MLGVGLDLDLSVGNAQNAKDAGATSIMLSDFFRRPIVRTEGEMTLEKVMEAMSSLGPNHPVSKSLEQIFNSTYAGIADQIASGADLSQAFLSYKSGQLNMLDELQREIRKLIQGK